MYTPEAFAVTVAAEVPVRLTVAPLPPVPLIVPEIENVAGAMAVDVKLAPVMFAAVRVGKSYVSYHLMPVYGCPQLVEGLSERLRARMQGKACFNFKAVDPDLVEELRRLTEESLRLFRKAGFA